MKTKPSPLDNQDRPTDSYQQNQSDSLASTWHKTATQPWHEYMKTVSDNHSKWAQLQVTDDAENEASKKRVQDYITKYKHLF